MPVWDKNRHGSVQIVMNTKGELTWEGASDATPTDQLVDPSNPELAAKLITAMARAENAPIAKWALKPNADCERKGLRYGDPGTSVQFVRTRTTKPALMIQTQGGSRRQVRVMSVAALRKEFEGKV